MMTTTELIESIREAAQFLPKDADESERFGYHQLVATLEAKWRNWLEYEFAEGLPPNLLNHLYNVSVNHSGTKDYSKITTKYIQNAMLAEQVIDAARGTGYLKEIRTN